MNNLEIAKQAILQAGEEVMKIYQKDFSIEYKGDQSPFTEADNKANEILISHLEQTNIKIFSEEIKDDYESRKNEEYLWIIDPIDGTKDFINKTGEFSLMVGLIRKDQPVIGVVYQPSEGKLYFAEKGKGSFLETDQGTQEIQVDSSQKQILTSRNHTSPADLEIIEKVGLENIPCGSIGVKLGLIAEGKAGNYINLSNKLGQWDGCAPHIILEEAGGKVTDIYGKQVRYNQQSEKLENGFIATNGVFHQEILDAINS
ncbi:3'(2'),5'-bisphosphate nucleotidase CysQ family protein [Candidatus Absconditicoccus praedator]|uniref:3'(2'),5'-bisphosphate nucleotidase CysQ family protein n=1 Tax=Candidatus Absconditicoccus praedator TaxID=2735562 RepID=UPI001E369C06|nr:3'(2'),5'-bisphosphate nucleotidase CysQ [Candidatus Absconditicoccus praedator]UFX82743.1 3'(2'),5'-bisphosphate nucleotidase CysQ [Candidatus Absconditicoccus praedator]